MNNWTIPKLWPGKRVAILASGPSMSQEVADKVKALGLPTIAINATFQLAPWADMLFAADSKFWSAYRHAVAFTGIKLCAEPTAPQGVRWVRNTGQQGFDPDPQFIRTGANSGYAAIHIAAHAGASEIDLHGYDMRGSDGKQHWHGSHPLSLRNHGDGIYEKWLRAFDTLAPELSARGIRVTNHTPGSALRCFTFAETAEA